MPCSSRLTAFRKAAALRAGRRSGTSLVEVLVVMVVFLIGILAIVQIFPGGFKALSTSAKNNIATAIARTTSNILQNHADQLPDAIVPVIYNWNGSQIVIDKDPEHYPGDLGPLYGGLDANGILYDSTANPIGGWSYLTGANITRRVLGEGKEIPAPRQVGSRYGSLLSLQFAPLVYNPQYQSIFVVYGNDMIRRSGNPVTSGFGVRSTEFFVDQEDNSSAEVIVPTDVSRPLSYRLEMSCVAGGQRRDIVDWVFTAPAQAGPYEYPLSNVVPGIQGVEYDTVRLARVFDDVDVTNGGNFHTGEPYEYKLLSRQLGLILFNPAGYNFVIRTRRGQSERLIGRASYDVFDWRILHEEFRAPEQSPYQYKLALNNLKVAGNTGADGLRMQGIGVQVPDGNMAFGDTDLAIQDVSTGALMAFKERTVDPNLTSYTVDKSSGRVTFLDADPSIAGTQVKILQPGDLAMSTVTLEGRSLRALYMARGEWAAQVLKPAAHYVETYGRPGIGEYYIGGSSGYISNDKRIYFPPADAGRVVSLGEVYYINTSGISVGPVQLTAKLQTNAMDLGLPYIPMDSYYPDFKQFDYSYGTAVKNVKGASVAVRVLWNPEYFTLGNDPTQNMQHLDTWMQNWRRQTVETYLQREN